METTWIVIANASDAFFYSLDEEAFEKGKIKIKLISSYNHPQSRQKDSELITDRAGRFASDHARFIGPGSYKTPTEPKKHEADVFAKKIIGELEDARTANYFQKLILIVPPNFHGLLNKHSNKNIHNLIAMTIEKDYTKTPSKKLNAYLEQHLLNSE